MHHGDHGEYTHSTCYMCMYMYMLHTVYCMLHVADVQCVGGLFVPV